MSIPIEEILKAKFEHERRGREYRSAVRQSLYIIRKRKGRT